MHLIAACWPLAIWTFSNLTLRSVRFIFCFYALHRDKDAYSVSENVFIILNVTQSLQKLISMRTTNFVVNYVHIHKALNELERLSPNGKLN